MDRSTRWIVGGDTGISSKTIWSVMNGVDPDWADVPHDCDDFGRCFRLLLLVPEWRRRLELVAYAYPKWAPMVREWDSLSQLYMAGLKTDDFNALNQRLRQLQDEGLILCGWTMTAPGCGHGPARGYRVSREAIDRALAPLQAHVGATSDPSAT